MKVTEPNVHDSLEFRSLLESLPLDDIEAVAADSAYLSRRNCDSVEEIGAKPYIKLKKNITLVRSKGSKAWSDMIFSYRIDPKAWERVYHARSSAETAFSAIKRKFGHQLSSVRRDHQRKELMTKIVVYNLNIVARRFI
jgi:transposase